MASYTDTQSLLLLGRCPGCSAGTRRRRGGPEVHRRGAQITFFAVCAACLFDLDTAIRGALGSYMVSCWTPKVSSGALEAQKQGLHDGVALTSCLGIRHGLLRFMSS